MLKIATSFYWLKELRLMACLGVICILNSVAFGQGHNIHLRLKSIPATHAGDSIFVAGSFNNWNPGNEKYRLSKINGVYFINILDLKDDVYELKFTRGNWEKGEVIGNGGPIQNRIIKLTSDTTLEYVVEGWQDDFKTPERKHTASPNVKVLDTAFYIPQLERSRRVWIYLPKNYSRSKNKKRYPVIYMHDGQNVFDEYSSAFGEWGVDESLDSLINDGKPAAIVVAIDCGSQRMTEYNPYDFKEFGKGEGDKYVEFLVKTLKPFIDKRYRTLTSKDNTIIAGSSMGGLISYYAMLTHPKTFGKAGIFSPAFWTAPEINSLTDSLGKDVDGRYFFYMGDLEGGSYVDDMKKVTDNIGKRSDALIYTIIDPDGRHNEAAWRKWFPEFYSWVVSDGFNDPIKIDK